MRKKLKVILDYDDVLVDCNGAAVKKLNKEIGSSYTIYDITQWGPLGNDLDKRLAYYSDPEFIGSIPLFKGAKEFVHKLSKIVEVFIMTSVEPQCAGSRVNHIVMNFPDVAPGNIIIGNRKDMFHADVILDDGYHNLEHSNTTYPVMFQKPWNFGKTGILSVNSYDAFLQLVNIVCETQTKNAEEAEVVSLIGPTGAGKKMLADALVETGKFERVKTYTTKQNSEDYHILSLEEFTTKKETNFFSETSIYMGDFFGMREDDIKDVIEKGKIPLMILDINGAMAVQAAFNAINVFVKEDKERCIESIVKRQLPIDKTVQKIVSLDLELRNEELCDITVSQDEVEKITSLLNL